MNKNNQDLFSDICFQKPSELVDKHHPTVECHLNIRNFQKFEFSTDCQMKIYYYETINKQLSKIYEKINKKSLLKRKRLVLIDKKK